MGGGICCGNWRQYYEQLCWQADQEELPPLVFFKADARTGRAKRSKGRNLLDRLQLHQDAVLAFAFAPGFPFTNNQAERDLRSMKVKQRVSGCFRTESGAAMYARISGFISTMRKNSQNVVDQPASVLSGRGNRDPHELASRVNIRVKKSKGEIAQSLQDWWQQG